MAGQYYELKNFRGTNVKTTAVSPNGTPYTENSPSLRKRWTPTRQRLYRTVSICFGVLWIAPITVLLVFNYRQFTLGASIWCPNRQCVQWNFTGGVDIANARLLNEADHNVLGSFQFVAKALEVWFVFIATSLVYHVSIALAKRPAGLPLGFLMTFVEFSDLRCIFDPVFWRAPFPHKRNTGRQDSSVLFFLFALFAVLMCIVANIMGPAVAVLLIPSLQWQDTSMISVSTFGAMTSADPPSLPLLPGCVASDVDTRNYSCTTGRNAEALDSWLGSVHAFFGPNEYLADSQGYIYQGISPEGTVTFNLNATTSTNSSILWVPSRQVLAQVSSDNMNFLNTTQGYPADTSFAAYNNSLHVSLQRQGPVLGIGMRYHLSAPWTVTVDSTRSLRCNNNWEDSNNNTYVKCNRVGRGWNSTNGIAEFSLGNASHALLYSSDKSFFVSDTYNPANIPPRCYNFTSATADCNWDAYFNTPWNERLSNVSANTVTTEYMPSFSKKSFYAKTSGLKLVIELFTYLDFATYVLNASPNENPSALVQLDSLPDYPTGKPIPVNIDWILSALSVSDNGTIPLQRRVAANLQEDIDIMMSPNTTDLQTMTAALSVTLTTSIYHAQAVSMIPYKFDNPRAGASPNDPTNPLLQRNARLYVWMYSVGGTRTSYLGVAVTSLGILLTLIRTIVVFRSEQRQRSPLEIVVSTLEHRPAGEFDGLGDREGKHAKIRFQVNEDMEGRIKFQPASTADESMSTPMLRHSASAQLSPPPQYFSPNPYQSGSAPTTPPGAFQPMVSPGQFSAFQTQSGHPDWTTR